MLRERGFRQKQVLARPKILHRVAHSTCKASLAHLRIHPQEAQTVEAPTKEGWAQEKRALLESKATRMTRARAGCNVGCCRESSCTGVGGVGVRSPSRLRSHTSCRVPCATLPLRAPLSAPTPGAPSSLPRLLSHRYSAGFGRPAPLAIPPHQPHMEANFEQRVKQNLEARSRKQKPQRRAMHDCPSR